MTNIRLQDVTKVYGAGAAAVTAVDRVSLDIAAGELFFLLGPSGCGKTTLLRIVAGLIVPMAGRVWFGDDDVTDQPVEKRRAPMVFQNYALWPHMTVGRNVEFGPKMHGVARAERARLAETNLARVQMEGFVRRRPNQLSGGQQQRVALARALAAQGRCLLLDEPLSNLDARLRLHMRTELRRLVKATGVTAVYVTHDQTEALSMADRIAVMNDGRIAQVGTPGELYERPATRFVADFLGEANFIDGRLVAGGPQAVIDTPAGAIRSAHAGELPAGADVTCCVRPERVAIAPADAPAPDLGPNISTLQATVEDGTYLGNLHQHRCRLASGESWKVTALGGTAALSPGQAVTLRVAADDVVLLTD